MRSIGKVAAVNAGAGTLVADGGVPVALASTALRKIPGKGWGAIRKLIRKKIKKIL